MDVLGKLALRSLQKNRKRTVVTIIGIIMATALITAVANMAASFRASVVEHQRSSSGDFHYYFQGVAPENLKYFENNRNIERISYERDLGYALLPGSVNPDKPYLFIKSMDSTAMKDAALKLVSGRMPQNEEEIVIAGHIRSNGGVKISTGDVLELETGYRYAGEGFILGQSNPYSYEEETFVGLEKKTYTVVGIIERPLGKIESYTAPGYTIVTCMDEEIADFQKGNAHGIENVNLYVTYTEKALKNRDQVTAGLLEVPQELYKKYMNGRIETREEEEQLWHIASDLYYNSWLVKWQILDFSNSTMNMLYSMAGIAVLIIMVTSAFCIHNSFMISLSEKMKLYGMIGSMGATAKQRRKMVYTEAVCLGIIGIPLGVISGTAATFILVKLTSHLMVTAMDTKLLYVISVPAMIVGILLSIVTIFLSSGRAARKAGKLSPISAIQYRDSVKIRAKELRTPGFVHKFFGIGGTIAYKNLRRARGKYRTTVISIVVSVSVFIAMTTFVRLGFKSASVYYEKRDYQMDIQISNIDGEAMQNAREIAEMEGVTYAEIQRSMESRVSTKDIPFNSRYKEDMGGVGNFNADALGMTFLALGEEGFDAYCKKAGVDPETARNKAIFAASRGYYIIAEDKYVEGGIKYDYHAGDTIKAILMQGTDVSKEKEISIELAAQTDILPFGYQYRGGNALLIVSDEWMEQYADYIEDLVVIRLQCENADDLESIIRYREMPHTHINNLQQLYEEERSTYLLVSIFLYGFITVIALIGITSIFNTITANIELRSREFAMLKSVGMTGKEFKRLIQLESMFYGVKSLAIGITAGILLSFWFHRAMSGGMEIRFRIPVEGILISIIAVILLVYGTMRYSMGKIERKNIIETIQNENI